MAIDDQSDGSGNGGSLSISFNEAPPPPTMDVNVSPRGTFDSRTGAVTIRGTYTCTDAEFIDIFGDVAQSVGRIATIRGFFDLFDEGTCDGSSHAWSATVVPESGKFKGGRAVAVAFSFACGSSSALKASPSRPCGSPAGATSCTRQKGQLQIHMHCQPPRAGSPGAP